MSRFITSFVPKHRIVDVKSMENLKKIINKTQNLLIITGAGISTESGIPDYRSAEVGLYARSNHRPINYVDFLRSNAVRRRYWARNYIGWHRFSTRHPNRTHHAIYQLCQIINVSAIITQNVDFLHQKAGSTNVIELHGSAANVICLQCKKNYNRHDIQRHLDEINPNLPGIIDGMIRPDGDVEIPEEIIEQFVAPSCDECGGIIKPDIVFFGDNVPRWRVEQINQLLKRSDGLLIIGSSLTTFSSYRIVLAAHENSREIIIINIGKTRADELATLKIEANCGEVLDKLIEQIN